MSSIQKLLPFVERLFTPVHVSTKHPSTMRSVATQENEASHCDHQHTVWTEAEHKRLSRLFQIAGSVGPLYYASVKVCDQPVEALVDSGSSVRIMSFDLFRVIGKKVGMTADALPVPDVILRGYTHYG